MKSKTSPRPRPTSALRRKWIAFRTFFGRAFPLEAVRLRLFLYWVIHILANFLLPLLQSLSDALQLSFPDDLLLLLRDARRRGLSSFSLSFNSADWVSQKPDYLRPLCTHACAPATRRSLRPTVTTSFVWTWGIVFQDRGSRGEFTQVIGTFAQAVSKVNEDEIFDLGARMFGQMIDFYVSFWLHWFELVQRPCAFLVSL